MLSIKYWISVVAGLVLSASVSASSVDLLIVGGGASGVAAGIQASRLGVKTLIVEEHLWLGGMLTSAGVSAIDGNHKLPSGIWGEFRDSLISYYGSAKALQTGWVSNVLFEPSVGAKIWFGIAQAQPNLSVWFNTSLSSLKKEGKGWKAVVCNNGVMVDVDAKVVIDATELGDVAKMAGVKYDIGMEARSVCGEDIAPEVANDIIQDLTYVAVLKDYGRDVSIPRPEGYDPSVFYCTCKSDSCKNPKEKQRVWDCNEMMKYGKLPNGKYMINWPIEGNDYYLNIIELNSNERKEALKKAKNFTLCYLYYLQHELGFKHLGLADDEFPTADKLPFIPYHRESRRIHGLVRFNVSYVAKPYDQPYALYRTGIAVGDYPVDHHHARYPDWHKLPDLHFYPVPSYTLPLGTIIPQGVKNLIVAEKSISVSNLVNGSTRLQPVVLQIGQAAGALAALAIREGEDVDRVPVRSVQQVLLNAGGIIQPFLDLPANDRCFKALQRIGSTGILKGTGKNVGWSNQTWFYADSTIKAADLVAGIKEFHPSYSYSTSKVELTIGEAIKAIYQLYNGVVANKVYENEASFAKAVQQKWNELGLQKFDRKRAATRKEVAVVIDGFVNPFEIKQIDIKGTFQQ